MLKKKLKQHWGVFVPWRESFKINQIYDPQTGRAGWGRLTLLPLTQRHHMALYRHI